MSKKIVSELSTSVLSISALFGDSPYLDCMFDGKNHVENPKTPDNVISNLQTKAEEKRKRKANKRLKNV